MVWAVEGEGCMMKRAGKGSLRGWRGKRRIKTS